MLAELTKLDDVVHLVRDSGVQFMDFGAVLQPKKMQVGSFVRMGSTGVSRLLLNHKDGELFHLGPVGGQADMGGATQEESRHVTVVKRPNFDLPMDESLRLLDGIWLPLPYLRFTKPYKYDAGPTNWARMRIVALSTPDLEGNNYRVTIAFDTKPLEPSAGVTYLAPSSADIQAKAEFRVACHTNQLRWFLDQTWVSNWLIEVFKDAHQAQRTDFDQIKEWIQEGHHLGHYLNILNLLAEPEPEQYAPPEYSQALVPVPRVHLGDNAQHSKSRGAAIPVDLILDVGNSRTCGILIENQDMTGNGLKHNYVLQMRDLHDPERVYSEPFASRVEFAQMTFGKENFSKLSGRHDAFQWPTIARVGTEAERLCARRRGSEGSTGMSSPKRYLWDEDSYKPGWRFSSAFGQSGFEAMATAAPFSDFVNDEGVALYSLDPDDAMPAFSSNYSRSSLMTFMLSEVITQAMSQLNSVAQRTRMGHASAPRRLDSITMTVPPGLPQMEREILKSRLKQAVVLVWQCMGWHDGSDDPFDSDTPPVDIRVSWDEALCGQLVYLYTEICENFKGHPDEFFDVIARPDKVDRQRVTLASVDIGGGTTDLVVNDFTIDSSIVGGIPITPLQRFRDSFKVAGDDVLLDVIRKMVLPALEKSLRDAGLSESGAQALLSTLCGDETISAQDAVLRQQLNLQVFVPIGLSILRAYETFNPEFPIEPVTQSFGQWMGGDVGASVNEYVRKAVKSTNPAVGDFEIAAASLTLNLASMHKEFVEGRFNICKVLDALSEVIAQYPCDALLLTGRPSMLPGVLSYLRRKMVIPPSRIISMHGYTTNGWYPFNKGGKIVDPKTTAVVGAMLCFLSEKKKLFNFYFNVARLNPYSTMRYIGVIDKSNLIPDKDVLFRDVIKLDENGNECLSLDREGEQDDGAEHYLRVLGKTRLGFRQLDAGRWIASPLYVLELTSDAAKKLHESTSSDGGVPHLKVQMGVGKQEANRRDKTQSVIEALVVKQVSSNTDKTFSAKDVTCKLYTMNGTDSGASTYWIDSGSVK